MDRKVFAIVLLILGAAFILGALFSWFDNLTAAEPVGLGKWIFDVLQFAVGAGAGIGGWLSLKKSKQGDAGTKIQTVGDSNQVATGEKARIIKAQEYREQNIQNYYEAPKANAPALSPLHQLPQPPADFTGREEQIAQLIDDFHSNKGAAITGKSLHGLIGMGGVGKTALGLVVAHKIAKDYPDAQIFLDLKGTTEPLSAAEIMRHVILSFEPTMDLRTLDEKGLEDAYRTVLNNKKALLFLDNARSADQIKPIIPPDTCALLVTSRWTFPVSGLKNHALDVMEKEDAEKFLLELCPRIGEQAAGLAKSCGYLPLALRIAGSFLGVNKNSPVKDYLQELNDSKTRLTTLKQSHKEAELKAEPDLLAAFELSYQQLPPESQKRWRSLGVFPTSFNWIAAAAMWDLEQAETRKRLGFLLRYSLMDYDKTSAYYRLHDLLAEYACSQMDEQEQHEARLKHASHYKDVLAVADDFYLKGSEKVLLGLRVFDAEWENIQAGQAWAASTQANDPATAELCMSYPNVGPYILDLRQHSKERIQWLDLAVSVAHRTGKRHLEANALNMLGGAYRHVGDVRKAIEYYEQALFIFRESNHRRGEAVVLNNLGLAFTDLGDARKAIEYYEQALVIDREVGNRRGEANELTGLGNAYENLGDIHKAIENSSQALLIFREIGDSRGAGHALGSLGNAYSDLGDATKAIEFYEQSLLISREIGDRQVEGTNLGNLGYTYGDLLGDAHKAVEFYEQALFIYREIGDRRGEALNSWNVGELYEKQGELEKAVEAMQVWIDYEWEIGHPHAEKDAAKVEELRKRLAEQNPPT